MIQKQKTYQVAFRRSITFRDVFGRTTPLSSGEILCDVELLSYIPATGRTPAHYELATTLDGKRRILLVREDLIEMQPVD